MDPAEITFEYTPECVKAIPQWKPQLDKLQELQREVSVLKDMLRVRECQQKQQHEALRAALVSDLPALTVAHGKYLLGCLYWRYRSIAGAVKKAHAQVYGGSFVPPLHETEVACHDCDSTVVVACKSWNHYDQTLSAYHFCPSCRQERQKQQRQSEEERQQRKAEKQARMEKLRTMPYDQYLQTDHWKKVQKWALKRANYRCQVCNKKGLLDVHHRTYENRGCEEEGDVTVLCRQCHELFHKTTRL